MTKIGRRIAIVTAGVILAAAVAGASVAEDAPPPAPTAPKLVVSDKVPLGCCCVIPDPASGSSPGCSYGLSEDKCRTAGHVLPKWDATWTRGKCPPP